MKSKNTNAYVGYTVLVIVLTFIIGSCIEFVGPPPGYTQASPFMAGIHPVTPDDLGKLVAVYKGEAKYFKTSRAEATWASVSKEEKNRRHKVGVVFCIVEPDGQYSYDIHYDVGFLPAIFGKKLPVKKAAKPPEKVADIKIMATAVEGSSIFFEEDVSEVKKKALLQHEINKVAVAQLKAGWRDYEATSYTPPPVVHFEEGIPIGAGPGRATIKVPAGDSMFNKPTKDVLRGDKIMTFTTLLWGTYVSSLTPIMYAWMLGWVFMGVMGLIHYGRCYVLDKFHNPWTIDLRDTWVKKYLFFNFNCFGDIGDYWLFQWFICSVVFWGLIMLFWPVIAIVGGFIVVMRGLRWAFRTKKAVEEIKARCEQNHSSMVPVDSDLDGT